MPERLRIELQVLTISLLTIKKKKKKKKSSELFEIPQWFSLKEKRRRRKRDGKGGLKYSFRRKIFIQVSFISV